MLKDGILETEIRDIIVNDVQNSLEHKINEVGAEAFKMLQKQILLQVVDLCWSGHLSTLDHLRSVIGFRGYAQRDPLNEYKQEAFILFESLLEKIKRETIKVVFFAKFVSERGSELSEKEVMTSDLTAAESSSETLTSFTGKKLGEIVRVPVVLERNSNIVAVQFSTFWKKCVIEGFGQNITSISFYKYCVFKLSGK